jgi:hypothetical protein
LPSRGYTLHMSEDQLPQESATEAADFRAVVDTPFGTTKDSSALESVTPPTQDPAAVANLSTPPQPTPHADADQTASDEPARQDISAARDAYAAGRDITVHNYGPDLAELESVRLFSKSQRTDITNS